MFGSSVPVSPSSSTLTRIVSHKVKLALEAPRIDSYAAIDDEQRMRA